MQTKVRPLTKTQSTYWSFRFCLKYFKSKSSSISSTAKNIFRVRSQDPNQPQSHTLQVNDVFHKQQWLNCLRSAISVDRLLGEPSTPTTPTSAARSKRRPSSVSAIIHMEEADENRQQPASQSAPCSPCNSSTLPSPSSHSSSLPATPSSSSSPLSSPTSHKSKKDKKSLYSLGKRKETMVWTVHGLVAGENGLLFCT